MVKSHTFKGKAFSMVVKESEHETRIRIYNNEIAEAMGVPCLEPVEVSIDQLAELLLHEDDLHI